MNVLLKKGYSGNIEELTVANEDFRNALYTGKHIQLVLMSLNPNEDIGFEVHSETDQFFRFEKGNGKVIINDTEYVVRAGDAVIVPAGSKHNVINTSDSESLKLYTLYSPSHHKEGTIFHTKTEAVEQGAEFDGVTTE